MLEMVRQTFRNSLNFHYLRNFLDFNVFNYFMVLALNISTASAFLTFYLIC